MQSYNSFKVTTFTLAFSLVLAGSAFAGKKWEPDLDAQKVDCKYLLRRCYQGLKKTNPDKATKGMSEEEQIKLAKILSKRDVWATRFKKVAQLSQDSSLSTQDYEYLYDKVAFDSSYKQNTSLPPINNNNFVIEEKQEKTSSLSPRAKSPEQLWEEEITSNKAKWFNLVMENVAQEVPPSVSQTRIDRKKDPFAKDLRTIGSGLLSLLSGGQSEDSAAWTLAVNEVTNRFNHLQIDQIPSADTWRKTYGFPTRVGAYKLKNYYPCVDQKIKENRERMKQEFIKNLK